MHPYEELFEEGFKHQIRTLQNRSQLQMRTVRLVHRIESEWRDRLMAAAAQLSGRDISRLRTGQFTGTTRLMSFRQAVRDFVRALRAALESSLVNDLRDVAEYEGMFWGDRYGNFLNEIPELDVELNTNTKRRARAGILGAAVVTLGLAAQFSRYQENRTRRLESAIIEGVQSDGVRGLNAVFRVSARNRRRGRIFGETVRTINSWVQDAHTHAVSQGTNAIVEQNEWMDSVWTAMLDSGRPGIDGRTSDICISRNGKFVNRDLGGLIPPGHINCRSQIFPAIDYSLLSRRQKKALDPATRRVIQDGLPDLGTSTEAFRNLSAADQLELLGPTRFDLFKNGGLQFPRDFINPRTEERYTLLQIALRENIDITGLGQ